MIRTSYERAMIAVAVIAVVAISILIVAILAPRMMVAIASAIARFTVDVALKLGDAALDGISLLAVQLAIRGAAETVLDDIDVGVEA